MRGWFPQLVDTRLRQVTWPEIGVHRDYIVEQLKAGVTQATIHQRLRDEHGLDGVGGVVEAVCRGEPAGGGAPRPGGGAARHRPPPGEEAQVDYGHLGCWTDPATGRRRHGVGVRDGAGAARGTCSCGRC